MNFHSRLAGALEALMLGAAALLTVVLMYSLMNPLSSHGRVAASADQRSVSVEQAQGGAIRL